MTDFPLDNSSPAASGVHAAGVLFGHTALTHLGVIRVAGPEAAAFLQGQLTQDVITLGMNEARLAAFCNAKGRMQASFIALNRSDEELLLICSRDILPATLKRLSMFVLRAKAKLSDATGDFQLIGVVGDATESIAAGARIDWAKCDFDTNNGNASSVTLPAAAGHARALLCMPTGATLPDTATADELPLSAWHWLAVQSGIAMITQPIFEAFVPQMLNYESIGAVNFKKGCYPGQEVVARSQFRGTLKRRAYIVHGSGDVAVGQEVFSAQDAGQPCGLVAACAAHPAGGFDAIVSLQTAAAIPNAGALTLGTANGPTLHLLPLPYPLRDDI